MSERSIARVGSHPTKNRTLIAAAYRPAANEIALFVEDGESHASVPLSIDEATRIRDAIDGALKIAACAGDPLSAVPGEWSGAKSDA